MTLSIDERRKRMLTDVFGPGTAQDPGTRALESSVQFVRGLDQLAVDVSNAARGRRLTAFEAYEAYGFQKLYEVVTSGSAIISDSNDAVGRVLRDRRRELDLSVKRVASSADLAAETVDVLEKSGRRPIREYEKVARVLGLDERLISFRPLPEGNERLAVRLRSLSAERPSLSSLSVVNLSEAAWVALTQIRLEKYLALPVIDHEQTPVSNYGYPGTPPYEVGYWLADRLRRALGLSDEPISSMRKLVEAGLGIPVIQAQLDSHIAGATIESDGSRALVLNIDGPNNSALVRRSTTAHEVGHLIFDPSQDLHDLRVDEYRELDQRPDTRADPVEQRANAFAVQFLAPQNAAVERYEEHGDLFRAVLDHFGISFTAGRYQIWNGMGRRVPLESIVAPNRPPEPDWEAREGYTVTFHPIRSLINRPTRAGRFSAVAVRCAQLNYISWDTVAEWLSCSADEARSAEGGLADLYPEVFLGASLS